MSRTFNRENKTHVPTFQDTKKIRQNIVRNTLDVEFYDKKLDELDSTTPVDTDDEDAWDEYQEYQYQKNEAYHDYDYDIDNLIRSVGKM
jgi:hypothetical protein